MSENRQDGKGIRDDQELRRMLRTDGPDLTSEPFDPEAILVRMQTDLAPGNGHHTIHDSIVRLLERAFVQPEMIGETVRRLDIILHHVAELWVHHDDIPLFPARDLNHSKGVVVAIERLFGNNENIKLNCEEWFILLSGVLLHDVGLLTGILGEDPATIDSAQIRRTHHDRSHEYVLLNAKVLNLDTVHAQVIADLCQRHARSIPETEEGQVSIAIGTTPVRQSLLLAILKLTDGLDVSDERTRDRIFPFFPDPEVQRLELVKWAKHTFVTGFDLRDDVIVITAHYPREWKPEERTTLLRELEAEYKLLMESVAKSLEHHRVNYLRQIRVELCGMSVSKFRRVLMERILRNILALKSPNAAAVLRAVVSMLEDLLTRGVEDMVHLERYLSTDMDCLIGYNRSYLALKNLRRILRSVIVSGKPASEKREMIRRRLESVERYEQQAFKAIQENGARILRDCSPKGILIYGYSQNVLEMLARLPRASKRCKTIYVGEVRNKAIHGPRGEIVFNDGLQFARDIRLKGFEKVHLVTDACVAQLYRHRRISLALLGVNGIDPRIGAMSTVGHYMVAVQSRFHDVPLYVAAETFKIAELDPDYVGDIERNWLTGDRSGNAEIERLGIVLEMPGSDLIPADLITAYITEQGVFKPEELKNVECRLLSEADD